MTESKIIYLSLLDILSKQSGVSPDNLNLDTTLNNDLNISHKKWKELLDTLTKTFSINDFSGLRENAHMIRRGGKFYSSMLFIIFDPLLIILGILTYPFNRKYGRRIFSCFQFNEQITRLEPLFIADVFNSILIGKWQYAKDSYLDLEKEIK